MLEPRYAASIEFYETLAYVYFGRPAGLDVLASLRKLERYEGIEVGMGVAGRMIVKWPPVYTAKDVVREIVETLRSHRITKINVVDTVSCESIKLSELKR